MKLLRCIAVGLGVLVLSCTAQAQTAAEKEAMQQVVEGQLNALSVDDGSKAYGFAAPLVQRVFPTVDVFMAMVKGGYRPVYRNSERHFGAFEPDSLGRPAVHVLLTAEDGKHWEAVYAMEQQADGSWKIAGCYLKQVAGTDV